MISINLLPDIKQEFIKAQRWRRVLVLATILIVTGCLACMTILFFLVNSTQKATIEARNKSINTIFQDIKAKPNIHNILTIQNQIKALNDKHGQKIPIERIFFDDPNGDAQAYIDVLVGSNTYSAISFDFVNKTFSLTASVDDEPTAPLKFETSVRYIGTEECNNTNDPAKNNYKTRVTAFKLDNPGTAGVGNVTATTVDDEATDTSSQTSVTLSGKFAAGLFDDDKQWDLLIPTTLISNPDAHQPGVACNPIPESSWPKEGG